MIGLGIGLASGVLRRAGGPGPELINPAAWVGVSAGVVTLNGSQVTVTNPAADGFCGAEQSLATQAGVTYNASFDVVSSGSGGVEANVGTTSNTANIYDGQPSPTPGTRTFTFTGTGAAVFFSLVSRTASGSATFNNVSVKAVL